MWRIVHEPTSDAWRSANSEQTQLQALVDAFGGSPVTARLFAPDGVTLRRVLTLPALTIDTAADPRRIVLGAHLADTAVSTGALGRWVLRTAGGVDIIQAPAGVSGATINHAGGGVLTLCTPTLAGVAITADAVLPPVFFPAWVPTTLFAAALVPMTNTLDSVMPSGPWDAGGNASDLEDFSGGAYNPYMGDFGAMLIHGSGHSAANNNGVVAANLNTLAFQLLRGPTDLRTTGRWVDYRGGGFGVDLGFIADSYDYFAARGPNSTGWNTPTNSGQWEFSNAEANWGEYVPNEPCSDHTYGNLCVLTPEHSGEAAGAMFRACTAAGAMVPQISTNKSHTFGCTSLTWNRATAVTGTRDQVRGDSISYDYTRGIILGGLKAGNEFARYTISTQTWTGIFNATPWDTVGRVMACYHATRDLHIIVYRRPAGTLHCQYIPGNNITGAARTDRTFTNGALPSVGPSSVFDCPERGSFFIYSLDTPDTLYEVTVPADPTTQWTWTARTITGTNRPSTLSPGPGESIYGRMAYSAALKSIVWVTAQVEAQPTFGGRVLAIRVVA